VLPGVPPLISCMPSTSTQSEDTTMNTFVMGDADTCIGCQACMIACARAHENVPAQKLAELSVPFHSRVKVINAPEVTVPIQCRQCEDSPCAKVCPAHAIALKGSEIEITKELCIGCKRCVRACPFGAISVTVDRSKPSEAFTLDTQKKPKKKLRFTIDKCDLCADTDGLACVDICPAQALQLVNPNTLQKKNMLLTSQNHPLPTKPERVL